MSLNIESLNAAERASSIQPLFITFKSREKTTFAASIDTCIVSCSVNKLRFVVVEWNTRQKLN